jgi:hypothetical protein
MVSNVLIHVVYVCEIVFLSVKGEDNSKYMETKEN